LAVAAKSGVLLLAHGSPVSLHDIPEFLLRVTGGRPVPPEVVEEVKHRYALIGASPLTCWTFEQRDLLARELGLGVYVGMRNWKPFIGQAVEEIAADGVRRVVAICLAPQNSRTSVGLYRSALSESREVPFTIDFIESWHDHPLLIKAFAEKLRSGLDEARKQSGGRLPVIFTAHSVPQRTITDGDPYENQARQTAALVAREMSLAPDDWVFAFQSQGMSGGAWLGPTVEATILSLREKGHGGVFVQPVGFVCDHVEVLYDIDIAFKKFAAKHEMHLWRAESLNGSELLTAALADLARSRLTPEMTNLNQSSAV
jgi:protoporphyrin/coproporphyrin ferrochelatase